MQVYLSEHIAPSAYARLARHFEIVDNFDHPEQLAVILYNYTKQFASGSLTATGSLAGFPDAGSVSSWARTEMAWAVGNGLISGTGSGSVAYLSPQGSATRAQVAAILMRFEQAMA